MTALLTKNLALPVPSPESMGPEARFRRLQEMIDGPVSGRWAAVETMDFLSKLHPGGVEMESYLLPLAEPLAAMARELEPVGLTPAPLARLADRLAESRASCPALKDLPPLRRAETALRRRAALLCAYAGAVRQALGQLNNLAKTPDTLPEKKPSLGDGDSKNRPGASPRRRLEKILQAAEDEALRRELTWLADHWALSVPDPEMGRGAWVPVVERLPSWASVPRQAEPTARQGVGALRRVAVDLRGPVGQASTTADETTQSDHLWTGSPSGVDPKTAFEESIAAARGLLEREHPPLRDYYLEGCLSLDWSHLRREGESAGLAIATLFYAEALETAGQRQRLGVHPDAALTGAISRGATSAPPGQSPSPTDGKTVQPVSSQGLPIKVQAAFFSPQNTLAVPKPQETMARERKDELLERYPDGQLNIVGISRLRDVMDHRRLTDQTEISWVHHAAQRLWDRRGPVAAGTIIAVLLLTLGALLYGPLDKTPATADFEGEQMIVKNASGTVIERISVGAKVVRRVQAPNKQYRAFAFHDVTGDGQKEICWGQNTPQTDDQDFVACKEVGASEPLWRFSLDSLAAPFPNKPGVQAGRYMAAGMAAGDFTGDDQVELYVTTAHQPYFPSLFLQLDAQTGEELGRYLHAGHFKMGPVPADLDGDDTEELLIGGHTNAYDQAAFAVIDPRHIQGHGPVTTEYAVSGYAPAAERAYVRFPRTKVGAAQGDGLPLVRGIAVREEGRIEVQVREGRLGSAEQGDQAYILVYYDQSLRPRAVGTSSHYDRLADTLAQRGQIDVVPDPDYFERYRDRLQYWTGEGWSTEPTMNALRERALEADSSGS